MRKKRMMLLLSMCFVIVVTGCEQAKMPLSESENQNSEKQESDRQETEKQESEEKQEPEQERKILYENKAIGIRVHETPNWVVGQEIAEPFNITFENNQLKAIITVISIKQSFNEIKRELEAGAGSVSIIKETDDHLAFKTERKESIRTDIYLHQDGLHTKIITFMTPLKDFETNQEKIEDFRKNIEFFKI